jgi:hypothetical protein
MSYKDSEGYYEASQYLGQRVGKGDTFLQKTACMDVESRRLLAILEFIKDAEPETKDEINEILPLIEKMGKAQWSRDVITDLALKLSITEIAKRKAYTRDGSGPTDGSK